ncbi:hypothetical protein R1sor_005059 [Riccia sorocarpa]|uniref:Uncharacterized protein n=1 Tax=Riccia sorocarpa TaxID=122646 RepID=A0ABD3HJ22_9MARC
MKPSFHVFVVPNYDKEPEFTLEGNFFLLNYTIHYHDVLVAQVNKKLTVVGFLVGKDVIKYVVTLQPGVDQAFIAALVVIVDQVAQDDI